jgi:hypothetical protein
MVLWVPEGHDVVQSLTEALKRPTFSKAELQNSWWLEIHTSVSIYKSHYIILNPIKSTCVVPSKSIHI